MSHDSNSNNSGKEAVTILSSSRTLSLNYYDEESIVSTAVSAYEHGVSYFSRGNYRKAAKFFELALQSFAALSARKGFPIEDSSPIPSSPNRSFWSVTVDADNNCNASNNSNDDDDNNDECQNKNINDSKNLHVEVTTQVAGVHRQHSNTILFGLFSDDKDDGTEKNKKSIDTPEGNVGYDGTPIQPVEDGVLADGKDCYDQSDTMPFDLFSTDDDDDDDNHLEAGKHNRRSSHQRGSNLDIEAIERSDEGSKVFYDSRAMSVALCSSDEDGENESDTSNTGLDRLLTTRKSRKMASTSTRTDPGTNGSIHRDPTSSVMDNSSSSSELFPQSDNEGDGNSLGNQDYLQEFSKSGLTDALSGMNH